MNIQGIKIMNVFFLSSVMLKFFHHIRRRGLVGKTVALAAEGGGSSPLFGKTF